MTIMFIKKMKYKLLSVLTVVSGLLLLYGCDEFLTEPARGSLSEQVLANEQGVNAQLIGAYAKLDGGGWDVPGLPWEKSQHNWIYGDIVAGDAHKGSNAGDQAPINSIQRGNSDPSIGFFDSKWQSLFEGVTRANAVLGVLQQVEDLSPEEINSLAAEARFLRGHYYFELRKMFFRVPWIDENTEDVNQPNDEEIWPNIEADFQFAFDNLPEVQSERARVNKWAAGAYLGKTFAYQQKWGEAKSIFDQVITSGVTAEGVPYDLAENYWDAFDPAAEAGNPEKVFFASQVANDGTGDITRANHGAMLNFPFNSPFRCCGFFQATQDLVNSYRTEDGLPIIGNFNNESVVSDQGIPSDELFEPYDGTLDPRLDWTVGRRGVPFHDWGPHPGERWVRDQLFSGPYAPKKKVYWQSQEDEFADNNQWAPGTAHDINVIRFADVLLMAAEAEIEAGSIDQAREYVNRVRERAARPDGRVSNDLNREFAAAIVGSQDEMLDLEGLNSGNFVVREDLNSTFTFLGGNVGDINNWNEYPEPNYEINTYPPGSLGSQQQAREIVWHERRIELALEGHRFFDLVRWGIADREINRAWQFEATVFPNTLAPGATFTPGKNEYYPIPQRQIDLSVAGGEAQLQQNPGF